MSYSNVVYFPVLMRVLTSKCPTQCPTLLKYIMHIQDSFKKNRNSKTFHYRERFRQSLLSFRICFAPRPGFVVNRFRFGNRLCSFHFEILQTLFFKNYCCEGIMDLFGLEKKMGLGIIVNC